MRKGEVAGRVADVVAGVVVGGIVGAIIAVNIVIFAGPDQGYESSLGEAFEHSPLTGVVVVAALAGGPLLGVVLARRFRRKLPRSSA